MADAIVVVGQQQEVAAVGDEDRRTRALVVDQPRDGTRGAVDREAHAVDADGGAAEGDVQPDRAEGRAVVRDLRRTDLPVAGETDIGRGRAVGREEERARLGADAVGAQIRDHGVPAVGRRAGRTRTGHDHARTVDDGAVAVDAHHRELVAERPGDDVGAAAPDDLRQEQFFVGDPDAKRIEHFAVTGDARGEGAAEHGAMVDPEGQVVFAVGGNARHVLVARRGTGRGVGQRHSANGREQRKDQRQDVHG